MRNSIAFAILVAVSNGCAASRVSPVVAAASVPADFSEIPTDRCSPALDGLYVSYDGANDLIRAFRRQEADCQVKVIDAEARADIANARCKECASAKRWSIFAPIIGFGAGAALVGLIWGFVEAMGNTK